MNVAEENRIRALTGQPPMLSGSDVSELNEVLLAIQDRKNARDRLAGIIEREKMVASRLVCESVKPEVQRLGKRFAEAMLQLHSSHSLYAKYIDEIEDVGASIGSLGRVWPTGLGHWADPGGPYHYFFEELSEAGFIDKASIPVEVR